MFDMDLSFYNKLAQPQQGIDVGAMMQNRLKRQMMNTQQEQAEFNLDKAREDREYQLKQRAQAGAAYAKDQAAEKDATNAFNSTAQPGYVVNPDLTSKFAAGAASDIGYIGGDTSQYPDLQGQRVDATPPNFDAGVKKLVDAGKFDAALKLMKRNDEKNNNTKSNLGVEKAQSETTQADLNTQVKHIEFFTNQLPAVTQQSWGAWRSNVLAKVPALAAQLPEAPPADPAQFDQLKRSLMAKASDSLNDHYEKTAKGLFAVNKGTGIAAPVPGGEDITSTVKEPKSKLSQAQAERQALVDALQKDPYNSALQQQVRQYDALIAKETKEPGDPNADIPPNSKLFLEQTQKHEKDLKAVNGAVQNVQRVNDKIDAILDPKNDKAFNDLFGGYGAYATALKSGDTAKVKGKLDSLKSEMKNAGLNIIRNKGSVGAMTEREWPIVQDMIDTLSPTMSVDDARTVIAGIKNILANAAENDKSVYNRTWGQTQFHAPDYGYVPMGQTAAPTIRKGGGAATPATPAAPSGPSADDLVKMYSGAKQ